MILFFENGKGIKFGVFLFILMFMMIMVNMLIIWFSKEFFLIFMCVNVVKDGW